MRCTIALGGGLVLLGCDAGGGGGGGGNAAGSSGDIGGAAGGSSGGSGGGRVIVASENALSLIDTRDGSELASLPFDFFAEALDLAGDAVAFADFIVPL